MTQEQFNRASATGISKKFKLDGSLATSNMVLFDNKGRLNCYATPQDIVQEFYEVRRGLYVRRKVRIVSQVATLLTISIAIAGRSTWRGLQEDF